LFLLLETSGDTAKIVKKWPRIRPTYKLTESTADPTTPRKILCDIALCRVNCGLERHIEVLADRGIQTEAEHRAPIEIVAAQLNWLE
jgi:hypothetical protein